MNGIKKEKFSSRKGRNEIFHFAFTLQDSLHTVFPLTLLPNQSLVVNVMAIPKRNDFLVDTNTAVVTERLNKADVVKIVSLYVDDQTVREI